jgi:hypothetical protein
MRIAISRTTAPDGHPAVLFQADEFHLLLVMTRGRAAQNNPGRRQRRYADPVVATAPPASACPEGQP